MGVWPERLPRHEAKPRGGEIIKGRWVDTSKGDALRPGYRARLFGKEFSTGVDPALFAATPPLEAFKFRISRAAGDDRVHCTNQWAQVHLFVNTTPEVLRLEPNANGAFGSDTYQSHYTNAH